LTATPTQTSSSTPTPTPTTTTTLTATSTSTPTQTPTNTPSNTPNPVCPQQLVITNSTNGLAENGSYDRQTISSGITFDYAYVQSNRVILGTAPDGNNYTIYQLLNTGSSFNTIYALFTTGGTFSSWRVIEQVPSILTSGATFIGGTVLLTSFSANIGSVYYPRSGQNGVSYITYPISCPTPTPTASATQTPTASATQTPTPTNTPTNTQTGTPNNTPTNTSTPTPSATPSTFNPNSIPNLFQWFDTSDTSYMTLRSSGGSNFISGWTGKTGGSFTQATTSSQPFLVQLSGYTYSGASFSGTKFLFNNTISAATPSGTTTFMVGFNDRDNVNPALVWDAGTPEGVSSVYLSSNSFQIRGVGRIKGYNAYDTLPKQPRYIAWGYGFNSTDGDGNINGVQFNTDYGSFTPPSNITQMRMSTSDTGNDNGGAIFEVLMYNRTLTTSEINSVVSYLQTKWGYSAW
jgi:hypothetical protein